MGNPRDLYGVLRIDVEPSAVDPADLISDDECFYRIELADGRDVLISAAEVTTDNGVLAARNGAGRLALALPPGTWRSVYLTERQYRRRALAVVALTNNEARSEQSG